MTESLVERARRRAAEQGIILPERKPDYQFDPALIPQPEISKSPENQELDRVIDSINVLEAYNKWIGKKVSKHTSRDEIQVSCPLPGHEDKNPSASLNTSKGTWVCYACGRGGDAHDLAAIRFGHNLDTYKRDSFIELRKQMAEDFGYTYFKSPTTGQEFVTLVEPEVVVAGEQTGADPVSTADGEVSAESLPVQQPSAQPALATVTQMPLISMSAQEYYDKIPVLDWRSILPAETFMWRFMNLTTKYDNPDEYLFFGAMQIVAALCGDDVVLVEQPDVEPNLYVCYYGPSGVGKSRTVNIIKKTLRIGSPYDHDDPFSAGTYIAPVPASGEALNDIFSKPELDPNNPKGAPLAYRQVRALVPFDELAGLTSRTVRQGNTLKTAIMTLHDGESADDITRTHGVKKVENPFCQMISTTQPKVIREILVQSDVDSGFINRWIFAAGKRKDLITPGSGREPFDPELLKHSMARIRGWASVGRRMRLNHDPDAFALWDEFYKKELTPLKVDPETDGILQRADLTLMKFMIILAANSLHDHPTPEDVDTALKLWPYLKGCYGLLAEEIGLGKLDDCANAVLEVIRAHNAKTGKDPMLVDLWDRKLKKRYARDLVISAIGVLKGIGQIDEYKLPTDANCRYRIVA